MKSVLISIRSKWCELIASGKKTIEVRKTRPKLETPFKCYLFCTTGHPYISVQDGRLDREHYRTNTVGRCNGKVIGEFVCDNVDFFARTGTNRNDVRYYIPQKTRAAMCLSQDEIEAYGNGSYLYGWHISALQIYDKPREISDFYRMCPGMGDPGLCWICDHAVGDEHDCGTNGRLYLRRPPQSWCYVEEGDVHV